MKRLIFSFALSLLVGLIGCNNQPPVPPKDQTPRKTFTERTIESPAATKPVELKLVKLAELLKEIEAQKGKIVVIDFWATFCPPCIREFPHFVEFQHKYQAKDVVCMSVTLDDVDDQQAALKFLKNNKATVANYILEDPKKAQDHWNFTGIPVAVIYDQTGKLYHKFLNDSAPFDYKDVEKKVKELIK